MKNIAICLTAIMTALPLAHAQQVVVNNETRHVSTSFDGYIYMRNAPSPNAKKIVKLTDGTAVKIISCAGKAVQRYDDAAFGEQGRWCKVKAKGRIGYVFDAYLIE